MNQIRLCLCVTALGATVLSGCDDPLSRDSTLSLREQIIHANRRQVRALSEEPAPEPTVPENLYLEGNPERLERLDAISGPEVYADIPLEIGPDLEGDASRTAALSLEQAVRTALEHNLEIEFAQLRPALSEAEVAAAEAVFDATLFADFSYAKNDVPQPTPIINGTPVGTPVRTNDTANLATGIRKPIETGGRITVGTGFDYVNSETPGANPVPNPAWTSNLLVGIEHPLLRNFGTLVNRSQIYFTRNAHRRDVLTLHAQLLSTLAEVERAYWNLVFVRHRLAIQQQLLGLTMGTRDRILRRHEFDASPVQVAQSEAFVEQRREEVIRARRAVRDASDELKSLLHAPDLPLAEETLIVPIDAPTELAVQHSLLDIVTTALQRRPDVRRALLNIDDASIQQAVADNQRLPVLNLIAQAEYDALGDGLGDSYEGIGDADFINYLLGAQFEAPIGNRRAEANFRRARISRHINVVEYQRTIQQVVRSVKAALRELNTSHELIAINRSARRAAAENLRILDELEEQGEALTPEFLDLKLNAQQRLANAQTRELQSVIDYNIALAALGQATGTLLERNQVRMVWPDNMFDEEGEDYGTGIRAERED